MLPEMKIGVLETNGHQNYKYWDELNRFHPSFESEWMKKKNGLFTLNKDFYKTSGGIFKTPEHYKNLL